MAKRFKLNLSSKPVINSNRVSFDGHSFRLVVKDQKKFMAELKRQQSEVIAELQSASSKK